MSQMPPICDHHVSIPKEIMYQMTNPVHTPLSKLRKVVVVVCSAVSHVQIMHTHTDAWPPWTSPTLLQETPQYWIVSNE